MTACAKVLVEVRFCYPSMFKSDQKTRFEAQRHAGKPIQEGSGHHDKRGLVFSFAFTQWFAWQENIAFCFGAVFVVFVVRVVVNCLF